MYRPNFCADCGERVVRERWRAWASRRFCPSCERRHGRAWTRPLVALCLAACAGFALGHLLRPSPPPLLLIERGSLPAPALLAKPTSAQKTDGAGGDANAPATAAAAARDPGANAEPPTDPAEIVSVCGARTKKGTPCSRRVRGTGRCWQHRGRPAMLPASKLVVRG